MPHFKAATNSERSIFDTPFTLPNMIRVLRIGKMSKMKAYLACPKFLTSPPRRTPLKWEFWLRMIPPLVSYLYELLAPVQKR